MSYMVKSSTPVSFGMTKVTIPTASLVSGEDTARTHRTELPISYLDIQGVWGTTVRVVEFCANVYLQSRCDVQKCTIGGPEFTLAAAGQRFFKI
jgi:hypothetical protein